MPAPLPWNGGLRMIRLSTAPCGHIVAFAAAIFASASVAQERQGLHVFIIAERVAGQVTVDKRAEPFRGTETQAEREQQRLAAAVARNGEVVRDRASTFEAGKCILVYRTDRSTNFVDLILPPADMDARVRRLRSGSQPASIVMDRQCL